MIGHFKYIEDVIHSKIFMLLEASFKHESLTLMLMENTSAYGCTSGCGLNLCEAA